MSDEMESVEQQADADDTAGSEPVQDALDTAIEPNGAPDSAGDEGGIDLRLIVLLVVLAPFVIAMIMGLLERFRSGQAQADESVVAPEELAPASDA